ncbi:MAG: hypothetical protein AAGG75_12635 [Bacteroidota bacterium]
MNKINLEILKEAIIAYREEGKNLMVKLGKKYGYNINKIQEYEDLIWRGNNSVPRKGQLSNRWNYTFHGGQCKFYNKKHQQIIEVELINPPNFGKLDAWFVFKYLESTEKYKKYVLDVEWSEIKELINQLYKLGEIEKIE